MWCQWRRTTSVSTQQLVTEARQALRNADYAHAESLASRALSLGSRSTAAVMTAGEAAVKLSRLDDAVGYFSQVPIRAMTRRFELCRQRPTRFTNWGAFPSRKRRSGGVLKLTRTTNWSITGLPLC